MGPLVTRGQQAAAFDGIRRLAGEATLVCGGADAPALDGIDKAKSAFVAPTLLKAKDACGARAVHEVEVFGPAATVVPYRDEADACALVARGGGSLVASVYGEDQAFLARIVSEIGPSHGRLLMVDPAIATAHTGHGIVMPQCNHGGPGRAGAGEELGGLYGLRFYHQRLAVQGSTDLLASLQAKAASLHADQAAGLVAEINEDRARLEQRDRLPAGAVLIDDGRDLAVRADGDELGLELPAVADVDHVQPVREPGLLQEDRNFAAVAGGPGVNVDHSYLLRVTRAGRMFSSAHSSTSRCSQTGSSPSWNTAPASSRRPCRA